MISIGAGTVYNGDGLFAHASMATVGRGNEAKTKSDNHCVLSHAIGLNSLRYILLYR